MRLANALAGVNGARGARGRGRCARTGASSCAGFQTPELRERIASFRPLAGVELLSGDDGLDPREVALICDELLPRERLVVVGIGHYSGYPAIHVGVPDPLDLILPWNFGSVGLGLPAAIGAAAGRPDRTTVVFEGDGGVMMSLPELETAARCGIPLVVIVIDDAAYGAELHLLARQGLPTRLALFDNPDFVAVATALGLRAFDARTPDELRTVLAGLGPVSQPVLVRVMVNRRVVHDEVFRALPS